MTARRSPSSPPRSARSALGDLRRHPGAAPRTARHPRRHLAAARRPCTRSGRFDAEFATAFANGRAFLEADDALRGRRPRLIEWTGGRRPPGDEVAPVDLRIDHVYLVSCKYLSRNIANPSPARLFDGLLATSGDWEQTDWYEVVAPDELRALYDACRRATGLTDLPDDLGALGTEDRQRLRRALPGPVLSPRGAPAPTGSCARR